MLTHLRIKNFKAWKDTGPIRLARLTVIFGANSAGKSSLGHLLLALKQTALSTDRRRALQLGDANTLIDLGTFRDCLHAHDMSSPLEFELGWQLPQTLEVKDATFPSRRYKGTALRLDVSLKADKAEQPDATRIAYQLATGAEIALDATLMRDEAGKVSLTSERYELKKADGRKGRSTIRRSFTAPRM